MSVQLLYKPQWLGTSRPLREDFRPADLGFIPSPLRPHSQVFYNKVDASSIGVSSVASATPLTQYQYSTVITDPGAGYLGTLLFPGDATAKATVGFMQTFLLPIPGAWTGPLSFTVSVPDRPAWNYCTGWLLTLHTAFTVSRPAGPCSLHSSPPLLPT